jgi:hypothetical protein
MPSFEEALKNTLLGINKGFEIADADLHQEVASAALALGRLTDGALVLALAPHQESDKGIEYRLLLTGENYEVTLGFFLVGSIGYPIRYAGNQGGLNMGGEPAASDRTALASFFSSMASNPDSPLVRHLAFFLRRKKTPGNGA